MFIHNINPVLFNIGPFQIRYYGIIFAIGFIISYYMISYLAKKRKLEISKDNLNTLILYIVIGIIIGARTGHVLSNYNFYINNLLQIFAIWQGGLSFHGGLTGALIMGYYFTKKKKIDFFELADIAVIPLAFVLGLGRIANFTNAELYGKITNLPWAVKFPNIEGFRHPSQLYESIKNFFIFSILWYTKDKKLPKGFLFWLFITLYGSLRFIIEYFFREPISPLGFLIFNLTITNISNIIMFIIGISMLYKIKKKFIRNNKN